LAQLCPHGPGYTVKQEGVFRDLQALPVDKSLYVVPGSRAS
jgi:hypothetical protein